MIEHGPLKSIRGIIVHQTGSATANATLSSYQHAGANGAHFLIDKDGTIYQVASLKRSTWHVGKLRRKYMESFTCPAAEMKAVPKFQPLAIHKIEMRKEPPLRFPSNEDSIGIEIVGDCVLDPKYIRPGMTKEEIQDVTNKKGVFEAVTPAQELALRSLVSSLESKLIIPEDEVYRHPRVSYKNATEAATAHWSDQK